MDGNSTRNASTSTSVEPNGVKRRKQSRKKEKKGTPPESGKQNQSLRGTETGKTEKDERDRVTKERREDREVA
jgi:hypothetical protein